MEDLCNEAFARALTAIRNGHGPHEALRPCLRTVIRHLAQSWAERDRLDQMASQLIEYQVVAAKRSDPLVGLAERSQALAAFATLPKRWRLILELTVVGGLTPTQIAPLMGINPMAVASLA